MREVILRVRDRTILKFAAWYARYKSKEGDRWPLERALLDMLRVAVGRLKATRQYADKLAEDGSSFRPYAPKSPEYEAQRKAIKERAGREEAAKDLETDHRSQLRRSSRRSPGSRGGSGRRRGS